MADTWSGGVVASMNGESPPTVPTWETVSVPGVPSAFDGEEGPIAYRRTFPDPRADDAERAELELRGVYGRAHVWINETYLGTHEGPIDPARFRFEPRETNELVVACEPSPSTAALRDRGATAGAVAVPGIRHGVTVHRIPESRLRAMQVVPEVDGDKASLSVTVSVDTIEPIDDVVTFSLRPNGFRGGGSMERTPIEADGDERVDVRTCIDVRDPSLWWPREAGPQHRYTLRAKLGDRSIERTIGLRTIEQDEDGLRVNGRQTPVRGLSIPPGASPTNAVDTAVDANATLVRFVGHVPPRSVYERCDEAGLLVWQDLPITAETDVETAIDVGERLVRHRDSNPSLAVLGVRDTGHAPFDDPVGTGALARLRMRWRAWRASADRTAADEIASALEGGLASVPLVGAPGTGADVVRFAPGARYGDAESVDWLFDRYLDDRTAGAVVSSPITARKGRRSDHSVANAAAGEPSDGATEDPVSTDGGASPGDEAAGDTALQASVESLRRRRTGFVLVEPLFDSGTVASGDSNSATDAVARKSAPAFEPLQAVVEGTPTAGDTVTVWLLNETPAVKEATVTARPVTTDDPLTASVAGFDSTVAGTVEIPADASHLELRVDTDDRSVRNEYTL
ncbi:glycoside hydrolase [Halovivax cerinus]|uniref:Glycoside hydrolase n=1 Tax=Halovivax cerinus TaxID=1487865 RepID=A0ABD5NKM4_9EURY|nr:glycoside hydrolase [Halovivax cerinus]